MDYTLSQIATLTGGRLQGDDRHIRAVATDSRNHVAHPAETLFVALSGSGRDGAHYIGEMYRRGVRGFLCRSVPSGAETAMPDASFVTVGGWLRTTANSTTARWWVSRAATAKRSSRSG